jgi:hypothetical protein
MEFEADVGGAGIVESLASESYLEGWLSSSK